MPSNKFRSKVLHDHGARGGEIDELLAYTSHAFDVTSEDRERSYPLEDEPSIAIWQHYAQRAADVGVFESLRMGLTQLRFPITTGISKDPVYRRATLQGVAPPGDEFEGGLSLLQPSALRLLIHPTPAGRVPVIIAPNRQDFESLLCALTKRNEPELIPPSIGAMMIVGYNNWDRIHQLRSAWLNTNPFGDWAAEFSKLQAQRHLYQDRFMLLSSGGYSGVPAQSMGFTEQEWFAKSTTIRLEHECAHYFTRRIFGVMQNSLHDELIADFMGIVAASGTFHADWFLRFLGLEESSQLRPGGRLENYRGDPPLSDGAFLILHSLVRSAASNLEAACQLRRPITKMSDRARVLCGLASLTVEEMVGDHGCAVLSRALA